jgi:hypothetical protein
MRENVNKELSERTVWMLLAIVFLSLSGVLAIVFNNEKTKPQSPHELVASAFNQRHFLQNWMPGIGGMGQTPVMTQTFSPQQPVWRPLPTRADRAYVPTQIGQSNLYPQGLVFQKITR